jgi:hypothetical protein
MSSTIGVPSTKLAWILPFSVRYRIENADPLRLRSGQAFDSAEERFAQDDILFLITDLQSFWLEHGFTGTGLT